MQNEYQENGVLRGPLILIVPASNLVAVMSLDWLDGTNQLFPRERTVGTTWQIGRELRKASARLRVAQPCRFRGQGAERSQEAG
jgi:hypothetical protein